MPSVKIPRKSTFTDMTPFVDVGFLILAFFILATKFKPPAPLDVTTPTSVSADKLQQENNLLIEFDETGRVYLTANVKNAADADVRTALIQSVNSNRSLGLTDAEMQNFRNNGTIGSPLNKVKSLLAMPMSQRNALKQPGIPVDSINNELITWIAAARIAYQGRKVDFMIKGDNNAKYPSFKGVIDAFRKNQLYKYKLITDPEGVPVGTAEYVRRQQAKNS